MASSMRWWDGFPAARKDRDQVLPCPLRGQARRPRLELNANAFIRAHHRLCRLIFWKGFSPMPLVPIVIERSGREERAMDIYSRLLQDGIIILGSAIDDTVANLVVAQMLVLAHQDSKADIHLYVNSPGGSVTAGLAIYDTMQWVSCDVATYCIGQCASMGSLLLSAGAKGKRNALPHSRIMIHQPLAGMEGTATDIMIPPEAFIRMTKQLTANYQ